MMHHHHQNQSKRSSTAKAAFDQGSPRTLQGGSEVGSQVRNLSQQQVAAESILFLHINYGLFD